MSIRIAQASIDENKKISGGKPGDQNSKEVSITNWYSRPWNCIIRAKDSTIAEKMAQLIEQICLNDNCGYNQFNRNSLYLQLKANNFNVSAITPCDTDCSALVCTCAIGSGVPENALYLSRGNNKKNMAITSEMVKAFSSTNMFEIFTDKKYLTSSNYLKRGDILLNTSCHTAIVLDNGVNSINSSSIEDFVERLYKYILNRKSDNEGKLNWTSNLLSYKLSVEQVINSFLESQEFKNRNLSDEEYIEILYNAILGRTSDLEGKRNWINKLKSKTLTRAQIANNFINSQEFSNYKKSIGIN